MGASRTALTEIVFVQAGWAVINMELARTGRLGAAAKPSSLTRCRTWRPSCATEDTRAAYAAKGRNRMPEDLVTRFVHIRAMFPYGRMLPVVCGRLTSSPVASCSLGTLRTGHGRVAAVTVGFQGGWKFPCVRMLGGRR